MANGFIDFKIAGRSDVFAGATHQSNAAKFGTLGVTFTARKPA